MQRRFYFCLAEDRKRKGLRCGPSHGSCAEGARETSFATRKNDTPWNSWKELLRERSKWQEEKKQLEEALKESVLAVGETCDDGLQWVKSATFFV